MWTGFACIAQIVCGLVLLAQERVETQKRVAWLLLLQIRVAKNARDLVDIRMGIQFGFKICLIFLCGILQPRSYLMLCTWSNIFKQDCH